MLSDKKRSLPTLVTLTYLLAWAFSSAVAESNLEWQPGDAVNSSSRVEAFSQLLNSQLGTPSGPDFVYRVGQSFWIPKYHFGPCTYHSKHRQISCPSGHAHPFLSAPDGVSERFIDDYDLSPAEIAEVEVEGILWLALLFRERGRAVQAQRWLETLMADYPRTTITWKAGELLRELKSTNAAQDTVHRPTKQKR